jgi:hypothetical protein
MGEYPAAYMISHYLENIIMPGFFFSQVRFYVKKPYSRQNDNLVWLILDAEMTEPKMREMSEPIGEQYSSGNKIPTHETFSTALSTDIGSCTFLYKMPAPTALLQSSEQFANEDASRIPLPQQGIY